MRFQDCARAPNIGIADGRQVGEEGALNVGQFSRGGLLRLMRFKFNCDQAARATTMTLHGQRQALLVFANHTRFGRVVVAATQRTVQVSDEVSDDFGVVTQIKVERVEVTIESLAGVPLHQFAPADVGSTDRLSSLGHNGLGHNGFGGSFSHTLGRNNGGLLLLGLGHTLGLHHHGHSR